MESDGLKFLIVLFAALFVLGALPLPGFGLREAIHRWLRPLKFYRKRIQFLNRQIERRGDARSTRYIAERDALMAKAEKIDPNFRASLAPKQGFWPFRG